MLEDGLQLFKLQRRRDTEHALVAIETPVRQKDMAVGIESEKIAEGLHGDGGSRQRRIFRYGLLHENLQGFPGASTESGKKLSVIKKIPAKDFGEAEDEMPVRYFLEDIHAEPLAEFHHPLLMAGGAEVAALAGKCQEIFMVAVITSPIRSRTSLTRAKPFFRSPQSR
jgi:hypothetical protein